MTDVVTPDAVMIIKGLEKRIRQLENPPGTSISATSTIAQNLAITGLSGAASYYVDTIGIPRIKITWSWTGPSTATSEDPTFDPATHFIVWYTTPTVTSAKVQTTDNSYTVDYAAAGTNYTLHVYAVAKSGRIGAEATSTLNSSKDNTAPNQPSTPTVTPELKGLKIVWNGLDVGGAAMAADFAYCEVHTSTSGASFTPDDATRTPYRLMQFAGTIVIPTENYTLTYVRLVPVDVWGNKGVASTAGSATPAKAVQTDITGIALPGDIAYRDEGNLLLDGSFESATARDDRTNNADKSANVAFINTAGFAAHGNWAIDFTGGGPNPKYLYLLGGATSLSEFTVEPNTKLYVSGKIRGISANGTAAVRIQWRDASGGTTSSAALTTTSSTGSYVFFESVLTVPATAVTGNVSIDTSSHTTGNWYFDQIQVRRIIGTSIIEDAAITNAKIGTLAVNDAKIASMAASKITTAELSAGVRVIAGSQTTGHAEMRPEGFITYILSPIENIIIEAARLGVGGSTEALAISATNGDVVMGVSQAGMITGLGAKLLQDPEVDGVRILGDLQEYRSPTQGPLKGYLDRTPRGVVGYGVQTATSYITTSSMIMNVAFRAYRGRSYRVSFSGSQIRIQNADVTTGLFLTLKNPASIGGVATEPGTGDTMIASMWTSVPAVGAESHVGGCSYVLRCNWSTGDTSVGGELVEGIVRIGLGIRGDRAGGAAITDPTGCCIVIEDIGPDVPETGVAAGTGIQRTYVTRWPCATGQDESYTGAGVARTDSTDLMQGYQSAYGDQYAHILFNSANSEGDETSVGVNGAMVGATVLRARVWLYAKYTTYNTGGTLLVYPSSNTSLSNNPTIGTQTVVNVPRPGGVWFDLAGFDPATTRSIKVGNSGGTNQQYYVRLASSWDAADYKPMLELTYVR